MSKAMTVIVKTLFWIFLPMTILCIYSWWRGNINAWIALIGCAVVTVYTWFLKNHFAAEKYEERMRREEEDD